VRFFLAASCRGERSCFPYGSNPPLPRLGASDRGASRKCRALGHIKGWRLLRLLWDYSLGASLCGAAPLTASARRTLRLAPSYRARTSNQSLCEHWLLVGLLAVVFCLAVVLLFHGDVKTKRFRRGMAAPGRRLPSALLATPRRVINEPSPSPMLRARAWRGPMRRSQQHAVLREHRPRGALFRRRGTNWKWRK
jgi:hypothetical protein